MVKRVLLSSLVLFSIAAFASAPVAAAAGGEAPDGQHWHFSGMGGTYDRAALQRGFKVYREVCAACHSMNRVSYRNLTALGYSEDQVKNIAAEYTVIDGPDDEGEMFERPARPSDHLKAPFANVEQATAANSGAYPPDLSLIVKARAHGADYIYGLLTGYEEPPEGVDLRDGQYWNKYMSGHVIAMPPPLADGIVAYEDGSPLTAAQYAKDVTEFLAWASEPHMEKRKRTGIKAIIFLLAFAGLMYAYKKKLWAKIH